MIISDETSDLVVACHCAGGVSVCDRAIVVQSDEAADLAACMRDGSSWQAYGEFDRAIAEYRAVLARSPRHYGAHYQVARSLEAVGRPAAALTAWRAFLPLAVAARDETHAAYARNRIAALQK